MARTFTEHLVNVSRLSNQLEQLIDVLRPLVSDSRAGSDDDKIQAVCNLGYATANLGQPLATLQGLAAVANMTKEQNRLFDLYLSVEGDGGDLRALNLSREQKDQIRSVTRLLRPSRGSDLFDTLTNIDLMHAPISTGPFGTQQSTVSVCLCDANKFNLTDSMVRSCIRPLGQASKTGVAALEQRAADTIAEVLRTATLLRAALDTALTDHETLESRFKDFATSCGAAQAVVPFLRAARQSAAHAQASASTSG